jgi:hypothetical protein|tara:strand:+ start:127 stop:357 length:231 start_codon:yes stop_codon:yes gene_type:complete
MKQKLKEIWNWIVNLFRTRYKLTVSYNSTYGDADDQEFIVKKFYYKQEKYISFKDENDDTVEIRGAEGLNYRIQRL